MFIIDSTHRNKHKIKAHEDVFIADIKKFSTNRNWRN